MQTEDLFALVEAALLRGKAQTEERIGTAESWRPSAEGRKDGRTRTQADGFPLTFHA